MLKINLTKSKKDSHSNLCLQVKQEVIQAETSQFTYHAIEYKLKKLLEHITSVKNNQTNLSKKNNKNKIVY